MPMGLSYLLARAADTVADTDWLPPETRLLLLSELSAAMVGDAAALCRLCFLLREKLPASSRQGLADSERTLLSVLPDCVDLHLASKETDRALVSAVLLQLVTGMQTDLRRFPAAGSVERAEQVVALRTRADLSEYTYFAAGCVGEFCARLFASHVPGLSGLRSSEALQRACALGKVLQMTNVVRDLAQDLKIGRCYVPEDMLSARGLLASQLFEWTKTPPQRETDRAALRGLTADLLTHALALVDEAWPFVLALPARHLRLRLCSAWPLFLALDTLTLVEQAGSPLFGPHPVRVSRSSVYSMLFSTTATMGQARLGQDDAQLVRLFRTRRDLLEQRLGKHP